MELSVSAALLAKELGLLQGVVEKRTTHQILTNVLLEASDGRLTLTATDLDTTFLTELPTQSLKSPGAVTAPARRLYDVLRELPGSADVKLKVLENHHVELDCKNPKLRQIGADAIKQGYTTARVQPMSKVGKRLFW